MARYRGPKSKIARKFGEPIFGYDKVLEKKSYGPGQHGNSRRRRVKSEYALQLAEKQKAKYTYGVLERQFRKTYDAAARKKGITGEILLQLLESRLDNTIFRLGIAPTRRAARQLVTHKHVVVNSKMLNIPSHLLKPGDQVSLRDKSKSLEAVNASLTDNTAKYGWLEWDSKSMTGKFMELPERDKIPENIKEQLIVELYSK